jgi:hypothetical protein
MSERLVLVLVPTEGRASERRRGRVGANAELQRKRGDALVERHLAQEFDFAGHGSRGVANTLADVVDPRRPLHEIGSEFGERDQDDDRLAVGLDAACVRQRLQPKRLAEHGDGRIQMIGSVRDRPEPHAPDIDLPWVACSCDEPVPLQGVKNASESAGCQVSELGGQVEHRRIAESFHGCEHRGLAVGESAATRRLGHASGSNGSPG